MIWPENRDFAFTIIDDTDNSTIENIKPIYDLLKSKGILTTKTVWVYPPRDTFTGHSLLNQEYLNFVKQLSKDGFEIQLHNVGSGAFKREEIIDGFEIFKEKLGAYPTIHINHASNIDCIYWGHKRFGNILRFLLKLKYRNKRRFYGDEENSEYFWGDICLKHIKFIRNRVFLGINTLKYDPKMPYKENNKKFSNYWFSSSDGHTVQEFNKLISQKNVNKLKKERGLCIVYTHFASQFVNETGEVNKEFEQKIEYLSQQNGWFVPATEVLDFLLESKKRRSDVSDRIDCWYKNKLDFSWLFDRVLKKIKFGR